MNFSDYTEIVEKLTDLSDKGTIIPTKHSWVKEEDDETFEHHSYHLPFDMYYIPRSFAKSFVNRYSNTLSNAVYILGGNDVRYCGKAKNADRVYDHISDPDKGAWTYQLLFVANPKHSGSKRLWTFSLMELLETKLIDVFHEYYEFDTDQFKNKIDGKEEEKTLKDLGDNTEAAEFAEVVVDNIIKAYMSFSHDNLTKEDYSDEKCFGKSKTQSPSFRFSMVGIGTGETLVFEPDVSIIVTVSSDKTIAYDGKNDWSLTGFVRAYMPEEKRYPLNNYRGPDFFSYNGEKLTSMRKRIEAQSNNQVNK